MPHSIEFPKITTATQFAETRKSINDERDVVTFHSTIAYARLTAFIHFICDAVPDCNLKQAPSGSPKIQVILDLLKQCDLWIEQCPPHTGARRFGNMAFRDWHALLESESLKLISALLPEGLQDSAIEVVPYFTGSFGSAQRLDFGTGHELSFFAFLCTLFQLQVLTVESSEDAKCVGLLIYPAYLSIIQRLIIAYTLEPAGSHGVWGLDDFFAMPYLLGAAQLSHLEPSVFPTPASITVKRDVEDYRTENLYFSAIGFINDVKKGPFWEHSPMLYDISGIDNWAKISTGMRKMYNVEVLGKFPVVQHFPFGACFFPFTQMERQAATSDHGEVTNDDMTGLKQVQEQTKTLHISEMVPEPGTLRSDTPVPEDEPTKARKQQHSEFQTALLNQAPTAAPWKNSASSQRPLPSTNQMSTARTPANMPARQPGSAHDGRIRVPVSHPDQNAPLSSHPHVSIVPSAREQEHADEETANTDGMEDGIGIQGQPGTKAPLSQARTIHPAVLESMRKRGEQP